MFLSGENRSAVPLYAVSCFFKECVAGLPYFPDFVADSLHELL